MSNFCDFTIHSVVPVEDFVCGAVVSLRVESHSFHCPWSDPLLGVWRYIRMHQWPPQNLSQGQMGATDNLGGGTQKSKAITELCKFYPAAVAYNLVSIGELSIA